MATTIGSVMQLAGRQLFGQMRHSPHVRAPQILAGRFFCTAITPKEDLDKMVKNNKVVVFMKGVPDAPKCGFSNAVVQIFRMHGVSYDSHNVLENDAIREGIKQYTNWPTIPQIFINGEFVGGCDIMLQMHQNGELIEELKKCGITSALLKEQNEKPEETK